MNPFSPAHRRLLVWAAVGLGSGLALAWLASTLLHQRGAQAGAEGFALVSVLPPDGGSGASTGSIDMVFNRPPDLESVRQHWALSPPVQGTFQSDAGRVQFSPEITLPIGQRVTASLESGVASADGSMRTVAGTTWTFEIRSPRAAFLSPSRPPHRLLMASPQPGGAPQTMLPADQEVTEFSVSPGGDQLALVRPNAVGGRDVWTLDLNRAEIVQRTQCGGDDCVDPAWLPDRGHLAYTQVGVDGSSTVWVLPLDGGAADRLLDDAQLQAKSPVWSQDGERVAFADLGEGTIRLHDFATGHDLSLHTLNGLVGSWSPDGTRLVASVLDISQEPPVGTLYVIEAATGEAVPLALDNLEDAGSPVWSPVDDWIAVSARRPGAGLARGIWIVHPDGSDATPVADQPDRAFGGPVWDASGVALLFQGVSVESLDAAPDVYLWHVGDQLPQAIAQDAFAPAWLP